MGAVLIATQTQRMDGGATGPIGWIVTGAAVVLFMIRASGLCRGKALRGILNDESSDAGRRRSLAIGGGNMLAAGMVCCLLTYVEDHGARDAIRIMMAVGISSLTSFGVSEWTSARS